jgi:hypothetical protein
MRTYFKVWLILAVAAAGLLQGCVSVDRHYNIRISRPSDKYYFVDIQWQTGLDMREDKNWENKAKGMAAEAIKKEFISHGLPCATIMVGRPTPYIGAWISMFADVGDLPEEELRRVSDTYWKSHITGQPMPSAFYRGRGIFPPEKVPNQSPQHNAGSRPSSEDSSASETSSSLGPRG